jgi:tetratricopeptide (TPR) repeat protein
MNSGKIVAALALVLALGASLGAQSKKWEEPYRKGIQALESGKYAEARELLERAIAAEPKAEANKLIEGCTAPTISYYYLALTFVELQQFDKAQQNLDKARPTVMRWQQVDSRRRSRRSRSRWPPSRRSRSGTPSSTTACATRPRC